LTQQKYSLFEFRAEDRGPVTDPLRVQIRKENKNGWTTVTEEIIVK